MKRTKFTSIIKSPETVIKENKMKKFDYKSIPQSSKNLERYLSELDAEEVDICLEEEPVPEQIERSKASYKIDVISTRKCQENNINDEKSNSKMKAEETDLSRCLDGNLNILKLNRMTWLSEGEGESDSSSCTQLSPAISEVKMDEKKTNIYDKHLSTIMEIDKEHNLFGMSHISLALNESNWKRRHRRKSQERKGPAFPQNMIIFVCCTSKCCKHKSRSDFPASLKCGGCGFCGYCVPCVSPSCNTCAIKESCLSRCPLPVSKCSIPMPCVSRCCYANCAGCRGMKIVLKRKPKYEPSPVEIASRAPSILQKPAAARDCTHSPRCIAPSSCFPYLMPCYWPATPSAPCSNPGRCFHNPPCKPPRISKRYPAIEEKQSVKTVQLETT